MGEATPTPFLRTKLHRPPIFDGYMHRPRLLQALNKRPKRPITLISAPAGYGKSILTSSWLETSECPGAWLSLDEQDNDLRRFLSYFLAAIRTINPIAGAGTLSLLNAPELPPLSVLAHELINELDELDKDFILVLDDVHCIKEKLVNGLLSELLRHTPRPMHLVLVGRHDPSLPLSSLRALGLLTEIRVQDLRFTLAETREYLRQVLGEQFDGAIVTALAAKAEGWITGLYLAVLALRNIDHADPMLLEIKGTTKYVMDYLISEVLSQQPPAIRHYLLITSILNRFNAPLCEWVGKPEQAADEPGVDGLQFIKKIQESGLFVIPLDMENHWFRYHHLFQHLLFDQLHQSRADDEIAILHYRAGIWFEKEGFVGEALHHFLRARSLDDAGMLVARHGHSMIDQERVVELDEWLRQLPRDVVARNPMLQVFEAWIARFKRQISKISDPLDRAESLLQENPPAKEVSNLIKGYMSAIRSYERYCMLDIKQAKEMAERAITLISPEHPYMRGFAMIIKAATLQMKGRYAAGLSVLNTALEDPTCQQKNTQAFLLSGLGPSCMMEADFPALNRIAIRLLHLGEETGLPPYRAWGRLYLACSHYQWNEIEQTERIIAEHLEDRYLMYPHTAGDGACVLAFSYQIMGRPEQARKIADLLTNHALETGNVGLLLVEKGLQAELALRQGRLAEAIAWTKAFEPRKMQAHYFFYLPELTLAKVLLVENTPNSRRRARTLLSNLEEFSRTTHNRFILIPVLALEALLLYLEADTTTALRKVAESITMAEIGGGKRFFLDLGSSMETLLRLLKRRKTSTAFVSSILNEFAKEEEQRTKQCKDQNQANNLFLDENSFIEPLTNRELEVLELLFERLQNKEIASKLFISPTTVKTHLQNIYRKLDASNRRQSLEKALKAGIVPRR